MALKRRRIVVDRVEVVLLVRRRSDDNVRGATRAALGVQYKIERVAAQAAEVGLRCYASGQRAL